MEKKVVLGSKIPGVEHHGWVFGGLIPVLLLPLPPSCPRVLGFDHKGSSVPFAKTGHHSMGVLTVVGFEENTKSHVCI